MKIVAIALAFAASSCVATPAQEPEGEAQRTTPAMPQNTTSAPTLPTYAFSPDDPQDQAVIRGTLQMRGECLVLARPEGDLLPIWPSGLATWNSASSSLSFNGRSYRIGESFAANGGEVAGMPAGVDPALVPASCRSLTKAIIGTQTVG